MHAAPRLSARIRAYAARSSVCPRLASTTFVVAVAMAGAAAHASAQSSERARIVGTVRDAASGRAIVAELTLAPSRRTTRSDSTGRFTFEGIAAGSYIVSARALGFEAMASTTIVMGNVDAHTTIEMRAATITIRPLQVVARSAERERFDEMPVPGVVSIGTAELARLPVIGDRDIVRAASMLPGIAARNDFSAGFNVRGGEADQNLVLLDGVPIYNPFHLGGLFGTFIDAAVKQVDVFTGAFPATYGGRLSSVLDVKSADDARAGAHATTDVSLLSASAKMSGATRGGRFSWSAAGRGSYADRLVDLLADENAFPYHFDDFQLHGLAQLPRGGTLSLTTYAGKDLLQTASGSPSALVPANGGSAVAFDWSNAAAGVLLTQPFGARTTLEQRVSLSGFGTHFAVRAESLALSQQLREARVAGRVTTRTGAHAIATGYEFSRYSTTYRERLGIGPDSIFGTDASTDGDTTSRQLTTSSALFVEDTWNPSARLQLRGGLRAERVPAASWFGVSPRASARVFASRDLAFTIAAGRYTQWLRAIRNEDLPIRVLDLWIASDSTVPVSTSSHLVLGVERWLGGSRFLRVEGYGKRYDHLLEQASTIDPRIRANALREFSGRSYGLDLYARQLQTGAFGGWMSYSYGVSEREFQGERYFPAHDRRHNANLAASWTPGHAYTIGAHLGVASGTPFTGWAGYMQRWSYDPITTHWTLASTANGEDNVVRGQRNGDRYPLYSRFDVSAERQFHVGRGLITPHLSVVNALNHTNVLLYSLDASQTPATVRRFVQFPLLPSIGVRAEF